MQTRGGFTIIARGATWAHVYREPADAQSRPAYGGLSQHGRVTWQADGTPRFEGSALSTLFPHARQLPTLDAVIAQAGSGFFEVVQRGDTWVDVRRVNPDRFTQFAGVRTYTWQRLRHLPDGSVAFGNIPPSGWLAIEIGRLEAQGWRCTVHPPHDNDDADDTTNDSVALLQRRMRFWPQPRRRSALLPWRVLPAAVRWLRTAHPERLRLSIDADGRVIREEQPANTPQVQPAPLTLRDHH